MAGGGKTLKITILGDAKSGQKAFKDVEASAGGLSSKLGSLFSVAGGMAVFNTGALAVKGLAGALKGAIDAAGESAQVAAQTNAVIKATGGAAGLTADQIGNLATSLSGVTPIDDEVIQSAENMLLTFKNIGSNVFPDATKATLDMATAMGTAPKDAALQLGKALNDPIKGITALTRVGVTFTQGQKDQIKAMVEAGDTAGAQGVILKELQSEFGGSAEAAGKTFPGQLAILKTALGNVQEAICGALLPVLVRFAAFAVPLAIQGVNLLSAVLPRIADALSGPLSSAFQFVSNLLTGTLMPAFMNVVGVVENLVNAFQRGGLSGVLASIGTSLINAFSGIDWGSLGQTLLSGLKSAFSLLSGIGTSALGLGVSLLGMLVSAFESIDWGAVGQTLLSGLSSAFTALTGAASGALGLGASLLSMLTSAFQSIDWGSVGQTILAGLGTAFAALSTGAGMAVNFGQQLYSMILSQVTTTDWSGIASSITGGITSAMNSATSAAGNAGDQGGLIGKLFGDAATIIGKLQPLFDGIMAGIQPIIDNLQTSFAPIMAQLNTSFATLAPLVDQLKPALEAIGAVIGTVLVVEIGILLGYIGAWVGAFTGALPGAIQAATGVIEVLIGIISTLSALIIGVVKVVNDILHGDWSQAWADAKQSVQGMADGVGLIIQGLKDTVVGLISGLVGGVTGMISGFKDTIIGYFQGMYDSLVGHSIVPDMINGIIAAFAGLPGAVVAKVAEMVSQVLSAMASFASDMLQKGTDAVNGVANGISGGIGAVTSAIGGVISAVKGAFAGAAGWLVSAGADVLRGFANGIGQSVGTAVGAAENAARAVKDKITGFFGIQSPSTLMIEIGHNIIAGLAQGLGDVDPIAAAADSAGSDVVNALIKGIVGAGFDKVVPKLSEDMLPALRKAQEEAAKALNLGELAGVDGDKLQTLKDNLFAATILIEHWSQDNQETVKDFMDKATAAAKAADAQADITSSWQQTFSNFDSIISGTLIPQLKDKFSSLTTELRIALSQHVPQEIVNGIQASIATTTQQIQQASQVFKDAVDSGHVQPIKRLSDAAVDQIKATMDGLKDGGASLIDSIISGVEAGTVKLNQAMQLIPDSALPKLKEVIDTLKEKLADALLAGTDPTQIESNIDTLTKLFAALSGAASDSADAIKQAAVAIGDFVEGKGYKTDYGYTNVKPGSSSSSGGGSGGGGASPVIGANGQALSYAPPGTSVPGLLPPSLDPNYAKEYEVDYYSVNGQVVPASSLHRPPPNKTNAVGMTASNGANIHVHIGGRTISTQVDIDRQQEYSTTISPVGAMPG